MIAVAIADSGAAVAVGSGVWVGIFFLLTFFAWVVLLRRPISETYEENHSGSKEKQAGAECPHEATPQNGRGVFAAWVPKDEPNLRLTHVNGGIGVEQGQNHRSSDASP